MGRIKTPAPDLGYKRGFAEAYELGKELGRGGNGVVRLATARDTGHAFAVKSIPKVLDESGASERKRAEQIPYLRREVEVLLALRGTLNVANLEGVYEDDTHVHLVLEHCSGGELLARLGGGRGGGKVRHYSERTAASFLRAVLRTVAQCHSKRIIHRDIKPENFLFSSDDDAAPLKAIDFGLAVFFVPQKLPVAGLNPEGTPWYLAPECCRAKWHPASDVWAVGVMACYLLTGAYPFLDRVSPKMPDLARTLRSICFEELDLGRKEFAGLSDGSRAFIAALLVKDPLARPSAEAALRLPFLRAGGPEERGAGKPLDKTVVQRIQRFAQSSLFKRTVLEHIAADLLSMHFAPDPTTHGAAVFRDRSIRGGRALLSAERSMHGGREGSRHGSDRDRSFRGLASAALAAVRLDRSVRAGDASSRGMGHSRESSRHGGSAFAGGSRHGDSAFANGSMRGGSAFAGGSARGYREGSTHGGDRSSLKGLTLAALAAVRLERSVHGGDRNGGASGEGSRRGPGGLHASASAARLTDLGRAGSTQLDPLARSATMFLPVATPYSQRLAQLFDRLHLKPGQNINRLQLQRGLDDIGFHLQQAEVEELFKVVDVEGKGAVGQAELAAGLIDWKAFEDTYKDRWVELARRAFAELDKDGSGTLEVAEIAAAFSSHLSPFEVDAAVHQALLEATGGPAAAAASPAAAAGEVSWEGVAGGGGTGAGLQVDFDHFLAMLRAPSGPLEDELFKFDDRLSNHTSRAASMWGDDLTAVRGGGPGAKGCCTIS